MIMWCSTHRKIIDQKNLAAVKMATDLRIAKEKIALLENESLELKDKLFQLEKPKRKILLKRNSI